MDPNQQQLLLTGGAKDKVYIDEVFNTQVYIGNATERTITTGIDLAGEGGLLWFKNRDNNNQANYLNDTTALPQTASPWYSYPMFSNSNTQRGASANGLKSFNSDGFTIQTDNHCNGNGDKQVAWSFRKAPAFFDVVQYDGDSASSRDIAHNLGCVPGMIIIKRTDQAGHWWTYHKNLGRASTDWAKVCRLNETDAQQDAFCLGSTTHQNASTFRVGNDNSMNTTGASYVAYLFAGGESKADTARSIVLNGSNEGLKTSTSTDYDFGTGDFTVEFWLKVDAIGNVMQTVDHRFGGGGYSNSGHWVNYIDSSGTYWFWMDGNRIEGQKISAGVWYHIANVRQSGTTTLYINGTSQGTWSDGQNYSNPRIIFGLHGPDESSFPVDGEYSNIRIVKGTAAYTESFKPPTVPLTDITNTKFLAANNSSVTGTTVGTAIAVNNPTASTDSPFADSGSYQFGADADSQVVKCGSYIGNTTTSPEIYIGWEPQLIIFKEKGGSGNWSMFDSMRGIATSGNEHYLYPNLENQEYTAERIWLTSTGFVVDTGAGSLINTNNQEYIYIAIRRPDAAVGKPPAAATDAFAMDTGASSSTIPNFDSGFPVDFGFYRNPNSQHDWYTGARLMGDKYWRTDSNMSASAMTGMDWDSNVGWTRSSGGSDMQGWMWKRGPGFDVVTYKGNNKSGRQIPYSLHKKVEMIWLKKMTGTARNWPVYHQGVNGGSSPQEYTMWLNLDNNQQDETDIWNDTAPTSTHFSVGNSVNVNESSEYYIAMLFASVSNISKVGSYSGSAGNVTVNDVGFSPRFLVVKNITTGGSVAVSQWNQVDTLGGFSAGNDRRLRLNDNSSPNNYNYAYPTASGFVVTENDWKQNGATYIYYAHA